MDPAGGKPGAKAPSGVVRRNRVSRRVWLGSRQIVALEGTRPVARQARAAALDLDPG